jgi:atypical dual specificity phosphatase
MLRYSIRNYLWWLIPGELAGMPLPFIDPARRKLPSSTLCQFDDDLPFLSEIGIRSIVSLVKNSPRYEHVYSSLGFHYQLLPIADGEAPAEIQVSQFCEIMKSSPKACAVHCEGGVGRTGTMLAAYLILKGATSSAAIEQVRRAQPAAIESDIQLKFLRNLANRSRSI